MHNFNFLVSIFMITFNHENFIRQALDSILMQKVDFTYEIVVGEDCSTDNTRKILLEYAQKYPHKFNLLLHEKNVGVFENGKQTLAACKGKYIAMCEGDDYWTDPYKLQKQVDFLEANLEYVVTFHNAVIIDEKGTVVSKSKLSNQQKRSYSADELVSEGRLLSLTMCFRNIIKFPPEEMTRVLNGDRFLMVLLGLHGKAKYMGEQIEPAVYRQHPKGIWSGLQEQEQLFQNLNSMIHIYTYLTRIGKKDLAVSFLAKQVAPRIKDMYPPPPPGRRSNYKLNRTNIKRLVQYIKKKAIKSLSCLKYK